MERSANRQYKVGHIFSDPLITLKNTPHFEELLKFIDIIIMVKFFGG